MQSQSSLSFNLLLGIVGLFIGAKPLLDILGFGKSYYILICLIIVIASAFLIKQRKASISVAVAITLFLGMCIFWGLVSVSQIGIFLSLFVIFNFLGAISFLKVFEIKKGSANFFLSGFLAGVFILAVYIIHDPSYFRGRLTVHENFNPSWFAAYMVSGMLSVMVLFGIYSKIYYRIPIIVVFLLLIFLLIGSQGRNSLVAFFLSIIIYLFIIFLYLSYKTLDDLRIKKMYVYAGVIFAVTFSGLTLLMFNIIAWAEKAQLIEITRVLALFSGDSTAATAGRDIIFLRYYDVISMGHIFNGLGGAGHALERLYGVSTPPHNLYVLMIVETAGTLLLAWLFFIGYSIYISFKRKSGNIFIITMFLVFFAAGNDLIFYLYFWNIIFILVACLALSKEQHNNRRFG